MRQAHFELGGASLRSVAVHCGRVACCALSMRGCAYDSRVSPPLKPNAKEDVVIYYLREGRSRWFPGEQVLRGPSLFVGTSAHFTGSHGQFGLHTRCDGDPTTAVYLVVEPSLCALPVPTSPTALSLSTELAMLGDAAYAALQALGPGASELPAEVEAWVACLERGGITTATMAELKRAEPLPQGAVRAAQAIFPAMSSFGTRPDREEMTEQTGTSRRQLQRDARSLFDATNLPYETARDALAHFRLRVAVQLLDTEASIEEISQYLGYGSARALRTALLQAGAQSPSDIRNFLRKARATDA